jgi:hypothetical protein
MFMRMKYLASLPLVILLATPWNTSIAVPDREPSQENNDGRTVTYRFTARVKTNDGVLPLEPGELIEGTFTYDLDSKPRRAMFPRNTLDSPRNALSFHLGDLQFSGAGKVLVTVGAHKDAEHFGIVSPDLKLPEGWEMAHTEGSQTFSVFFQNVPAKNVIGPVGIPERISLPDFVSTRELRLDFYHGVRFPGGQVKGRATVFSTVDSLEVVGNARKR